LVFQIARGRVDAALEIVEARRREEFVGSIVLVRVAESAEGEKGVVISRGSIECRFSARCQPRIFLTMQAVSMRHVDKNLSIWRFPYVLEGEKSGLGPEGAFCSRIMDRISIAGKSSDLYSRILPPEAQSV
jgi:hypothetical protein